MMLLLLLLRVITSSRQSSVSFVWRLSIHALSPLLSYDQFRSISLSLSLCLSCLPFFLPGPSVDDRAHIVWCICGLVVLRPSPVHRASLSVTSNCRSVDQSAWRTDEGRQIGHLLPTQTLDAIETRQHTQHQDRRSMPHTIGESLRLQWSHHWALKTFRMNSDQLREGERAERQSVPVTLPPTGRLIISMDGKEGGIKKEAK